MTTKEQVLRKLKQLDLMKVGALKRDILEEARQILDSGMVNVSDEPEDSFGLAKVIFKASLERIADDITINSDFNIRQYRNLR